MNEHTARIVVDLPPDDHRHLKMEAVKRDTTMRQLVLDSLQAHVFQKPPHTRQQAAS